MPRLIGRKIIICVEDLWGKQLCVLSKALNSVYAPSYPVQASLKLISSITSKEHGMFLNVKFLQMTLNAKVSKTISNTHRANGEDYTRKET